MAEAPVVSFGILLQRLRTAAGLTQEELAEAAGLSGRAISDLERGVNRLPRKQTADLLREALHLSGADSARFKAAARGRTAPAVSGPRSMAAATLTLPRDIPSFTGRETELAGVAGAMANAVVSGRVAAICEIGGMPGVGKTALAVHAAHQIATRFPDGQFYLPLHGHTPGKRPVDPADALASLLLAADIPAQEIPAGLERRAGLWRQQTQGKLLLLVLDDAAGHDQVRHLLPGAAGALVLITSRSHLTALHDSTVIDLKPLPGDDAAALFVRLAGRPGLVPGHDGVQQITQLCGYLPLGVAMLARQLHHHPAWSAADLAADLAARGRLPLLAAENISIAAAFDLSYHELSPDQQRLFRRLGLHPGTDTDAYAAAALDGSDPETARYGLEGLYNHYLLTETIHGRYRMHDLIAEHARYRAEDDPVADREAALDRLLDYYRRAASTASCLIPWRTSAAGPAPPGRPPAWARKLGTEGDAISWLQDEHLNLHACIDYAASHGRLADAIEITNMISDFMYAQGHWPEALSLAETALDAARRISDLPAQAWALNRLGIAQELNGNYEAAAHSQEQALKLFRVIGDRQGQAWALNQLGLVQWLLGKYHDAAKSQKKALDLFREIGDQQGEASALSQIGVVGRLLGKHDAAKASQNDALRLYGHLRDRRGQAWTLHEIGIIQRLTGRYQAAAGSQEKALELFCEIGDRQGQAWALLELGTVWRLSGKRHAAASKDALQLFRKLSDRRQAWVLREVSVLPRQAEDSPAAGALQEIALKLFRKLGDRRGQAWTLTEVSVVLRQAEDYPAAGAYQEMALELFCEIGDRQGQALALLHLSMVQRRTGDRRATTNLTQARQLFRELGNKLGEAEAVISLGKL